MKTEQIVLQALKDKAPALHKDLAASGGLRAFVSGRAEEINSLTTSLAHRMANQAGYSKTDNPIERQRIMNGILPQAREIVLAEQLEFQQDETSRPSQAETTASAMAT